MPVSNSKKKYNAKNNVDLHSDKSSSSSESSTLTRNVLIKQLNVSPKKTIVIKELLNSSSSKSSKNSKSYRNRKLKTVKINSPKPLASRDNSQEKIQSQLSFIVKEKLHEYAKDLRRRTSQV